MILKEDDSDGSCSVGPASPDFVETSSSAGAMTTLRRLLFDGALRVVLFGTDWASFLSGLTSECSSNFALFAGRSVVFADFGMEDIVR